MHNVEHPRCRPRPTHHPFCRRANAILFANLYARIEENTRSGHLEFFRKGEASGLPFNGTFYPFIFPRAIVVRFHRGRRHGIYDPANSSSVIYIYIFFFFLFFICLCPLAPSFRTLARSCLTFIPDTREHFCPSRSSAVSTYDDWMNLWDG